VLFNIEDATVFIEPSCPSAFCFCDLLLSFGHGSGIQRHGCPVAFIDDVHGATDTSSSVDPFSRHAFREAKQPLLRRAY
jgi:hypothetical protein